MNIKYKMCRECDWVINDSLRPVYVNKNTKCVYVSIPKCASSYIVTNILKQGYKRVSYEEYWDKYVDFFTWTIIRDPLERFSSAFSEVKYRRLFSCLWKRFDVDKFNPSIFLDILESEGEFEPHSMRQSTFIDKCGVDYIGTLENMIDTEEKLRKCTGVILGEMSTYTRKTPSEFKVILTESEINRANKFYEKDIKLFITTTRS